MISSADGIDPRLRRWRERLASRADEATATLAAVPGVVGVVIGGSFGRGEAWPLSDLDFMIISTGRPVDEVADEINLAAYEQSEIWGTAGIYTGVDVGRLSFDRTEVEDLTPAAIAARLDDSRWLHGVDKMYGGRATHDPTGVAGDLLRAIADARFTPEIVGRRVRGWFETCDACIAEAEQAANADPALAWVLLRRAGSCLAEVLTERMGERAGSLGRYWTKFERRAADHDQQQLADRLITIVGAEPTAIPDGIPEWLAERIELSYTARQLVNEPVTVEQNARDNLLAYALLHKRRFPTAGQPWMINTTADPSEAVPALRALAAELRAASDA